MKKLLTLFWGLLIALGIQAQSEFPVQFTDKEGNIIEDGSTLVLTDYVTDAFGSIEMPTNLYVKNMTTESVQIGGIYDIQTLDNGRFQTCFPENCVAQDKPGTYETNSGAMGADERMNMQTEWMPSEDGKCVVVYQLVTYKQDTLTKEWSIDQHGPAITLDFTLDMTGVSAARTVSKEAKTVYYDLTGRQVANPSNGLFIKTVTSQNGKTVTKKLILK